MIVQSLTGELLFEAANTRKLLKAIPDSALDYKPSKKSWTTAQLASHIANIYDWLYTVLTVDVFDIATYKYEKGDISKAENIVTKFEENLAKAKEAFENITEDRMFTDWKMVRGNDVPLLPVMPRAQAIRGFTMNHLYHHRGEMIVYLRATGNKVPGLYGPTADDSF